MRARDLIGTTRSGAGTAPTAARLRFGLVMGAFSALVASLYRVGDGLWRPLDPLNAATAWITAALIRWSGLAASESGPFVSHPDGFAYEIYYRCTGLIPVAFLLVGFAALPGRVAGKLTKAALCAVALLALNEARLVSLFWVGVKYPAGFDFLHSVVGEGAIVATILLAWLWWLSDLPATRSEPT